MSQLWKIRLRLFVRFVLIRRRNESHCIAVMLFVRTALSYTERNRTVVTALFVTTNFVRIFTTMSIANPLKAMYCFGLECYGPEYMTDEQVSVEARFEGIYSRGLSNKTMQATFLYKTNHGYQKAMETQGRRRSIQYRIIKDLEASMPIIQVSSGSFVSPEGDPVCIDVSVRGIPLLARVSNRSLYTIVGESVFEQLRLTRLVSLQTNKLVNTLNAKRLKNLSFTCLAPFTLKMGVIEVTVRNAIMLSPDPCGEMFGNQLGHDFLSSGTWCPIL